MEQPRESELVKVLVLLFAIFMMVGCGVLYAGNWIGFILLIAGVLGFVVLEIGGWRK